MSTVERPTVLVFASYVAALSSPALLTYTM
jgi:hypothetical protein